MWLTLTYELLGGLGIFFFGMKTLSDSLQSIAGDLIRRIINLLTTNPLIAVGVGALITTIVQSSSITTVMVVGLVNANLMQLIQAIGVIFGANIGTTITGWIIAIKVGKFGPLFVAFGVIPYIFAKREDYRAAGRVLIALGLIFMGLDLMSTAFKPLRTHEGFTDLLVYFSANNYLTFLACVLVGTVLTFLIQSSSAMLGITMALAITNTITFQTAAALVFGENIGTTITALLASVGANSHAKRAARAHALFNTLGVLALSPFFWLYLKGIEWLVPGVADFVAADGTKPYIAAHIATSHSAFNILNTLIFLPFIHPLARLVTWLTPAPEQRERAKLKFLPSRLPQGSSTGIALATAEKELLNLGSIVHRMFQLARKYVKVGRSDPRILSRLKKYEDITDSIQAEITVFICRVQEATLDSEQSGRAYSIVRAADELESIADYCLSLAKYRDRLRELKVDLCPDEEEEFSSFLMRVYTFYKDIEKNIGSADWNLDSVYSRRKQLSKYGNGIWESHKKRLEAGASTPAGGMLFSDLIVALRKIQGHIVNVAEALAKVPLTEDD